MQIRRVVVALGALAQETRLNVFRLLVRRGSDGLAAGTIADRLGVPPATLSFHLRELTLAGLIDQRREGRQLVYSANFGAMRALVHYLSENCCAEAGAAGTTGHPRENAQSERRAARPRRPAAAR
jgi:DNA-binding transcriptional ArsR family regulator